MWEFRIDEIGGSSFLRLDLVVVGAASCFVVVLSVLKTPRPTGGSFLSSQSISGPGNGQHCAGWPSGFVAGLFALHPRAHPPGRGKLRPQTGPVNLGTSEKPVAPCSCPWGLARAGTHCGNDPQKSRLTSTRQAPWHRPSQPGHHAGSIAHHTVSNWRSHRARNSSYLVLPRRLAEASPGHQTDTR
jgi:hypothetical protein